MADEHYDREKAEEFVDFITEVKNAAMGYSDTEVEELLTDKAKDVLHTRKRLKLSRIFGNPFTGFSMILTGVGGLVVINILPESNGIFLYVFFSFVIVCGIILTIWGIRNIIFSVKSVKNVYQVISEREQKAKSGTGRNRIKMAGDVLFGGMLSIMFFICAFMDGNTGILYRFFYFAIGFILAVGVYGWIEDIIDETKRREHDQTNKEK